MFSVVVYFGTVLSYWLLSLSPPSLLGTRSSGSLVSAFFTSEGNHIISASEDSNVYMWNYSSQDRNSSRPKNNASCESFLSHNASIAIPWCGMNSIPRTLPSPTFSGPDLPRSFLENKHLSDDLQHKLPVSSPDCFSLGRGFFLESLWGSPTWPEEKLPSTTSPKGVSPSFRKSEYKFLKAAYKNTLNSPNLWGLVIVTAGWDGRIRSYLNYGLPMLAWNPMDQQNRHGFASLVSYHSFLGIMCR